MTALEIAIHIKTTKNWPLGMNRFHCVKILADAVVELHNHTASLPASNPPAGERSGS